mmetsp:Transcript_120647/g.348609  ORF Transcript_120647/g.348609 Transcript_120647/m.348609 type:complete len:219 (-) Transcript_120647:21-677(-)
MAGRAASAAAAGVPTTGTRGTRRAVAGGAAAAGTPTGRQACRRAKESGRLRKKAAAGPARCRQRRWALGSTPTSLRARRRRRTSSLQLPALGAVVGWLRPRTWAPPRWGRRPMGLAPAAAQRLSHRRTWVRRRWAQRVVIPASRMPTPSHRQTRRIHRRAMRRSPIHGQTFQAFVPRRRPEASQRRRTGKSPRRLRRPIQRSHQRRAPTHSDGPATRT